MARIAIFGVTGMLGHTLFTTARELGHEVYGTARRPLQTEYFPHAKFPRENIVLFDAEEGDPGAVLDAIKPDAVINCLGVIKSVKVPEALMQSINATFPHELARACERRHIRMVQVSTDCVFSGEKGDYTEHDVPDAKDAYGKTKAAGEVSGKGILTIRTSFVGFERGTRKSLISWFLTNAKGSVVQGYTRMIWSGLTTKAIAPILIDFAVGEHSDVTELTHIAGEKITKHNLLLLFKEHFKHDVTIVPYDDFICDRSLMHERLDALGISVPPIAEMVEDLAKDLSEYKQWLR